MKISKNELVIYILLGIVFVLRLPGVFDGLPAVFNSTEYLLAKIALNMGAQRTIDPGIYIYPTFFTYVLFFIYSCFFVISYIVGIYADVYEFALQYLTDPSVFYILPRIFNLILSILTVLIMYLLLKRLASERIARYASFLMLFSSYLTENSIISTADTLLVLFSTLTILYYYRLHDYPTQKNFFICGLFAGLAIAAKYNAGFLVVGLIFSGIISREKTRLKFLKIISISLLGTFVGFFIMNPLWLLYPFRFIEGFQLVTAQMFTAVSAEKGIMYIWEITRLIQDEMMFGILFIIATVYYFFKTDSKHLPALVVIGLTFLFVGAWTKKGIDYMFAAYPAWCILGGHFIVNIIEVQIKNQFMRRAIILFLFIPSFLLITLLVIRHLNKDTRELATDWLVQQNKSAIKICYDNTHYDLGTFDVDRYLEYGQGSKDLPAEIKDRLKDYRNDKRQVSVLPILIENPVCTLKTDNPYESESIRFRRRTIKELIDHNVDYVICNKWYYQSYLNINLRSYRPGIQIRILEVQKFYERLFNRYRILKSFRADFWHKGPEITVYDLRAEE
jgi:hypothetical protein